MVKIIFIFTDGIRLAELLLDWVVRLRIFNQFEVDEVNFDLAVLHKHAMFHNLRR